MTNEEKTSLKASCCRSRFVGEQSAARLGIVVGSPRRLEFNLYWSVDIGPIGSGSQDSIGGALGPSVYRREAAVEFCGELYTFVHVDRTLAAVSGGDQCRGGLQAW